jgi:hypothetical protein
MANDDEMDLDLKTKLLIKALCLEFKEFLHGELRPIQERQRQLQSDIDRLKQSN